MFDILANAVKWAGKAPMQVQTDAPPTVEVVTYRSQSPKSMTVFLVNRTGNPSHWVRYVLPLNDIAIRILQPDIQPTNVFTLTGAPVEHEMVGETLVLHLPELNEYEGIIIEG